MNTQPAKDFVLFVHGFGSTSEKCWKTMLGLLREDERITSRYELDCFGYPTSWIDVNVLGRIPALPELGRALAARIDSMKYRGRELTLVGHSQGGLVIFSYFHHLLANGDASALRHIRQAIFFATPFEGSTKGMSLRRMAATLITNPQELTLRVFNPEVAQMEATVDESVINATCDSKTTWRVPLHAFGGLQDDIVPEASARGSLRSFSPVTGTHFSIVTPPDREDERYTELAELLLEPGGHPHRFEIAHYETVIAVEPCVRQTIHVPSQRNPRDVEYDNFGTIRRKVRFSAANRCKDVFTIKYGTKANGYVIGHPSHQNQAKAGDKGLAEDLGTYYRFDFTPESESEYCLQVDIYNGFGKGNRNVHFHHDDESHRRDMTYVLDLSRYVAAGYIVSDGPRLYLDPKIEKDEELCHQRKLVNPIPVDSSTPEGVYRWQLHEVREGVVDIVWDVEKISP